jgi:hypothetical protein
MAGQCLGRYPQAIEHYTSANRLARQAGWKDGEALSLSDFGLVYSELRRGGDGHIVVWAASASGGRSCNST